MSVSHVYDVTGDYSAVLWAYIPLSLLAVACFATLGTYPVFEGAPG